LVWEEARHFTKRQRWRHVVAGNLKNRVSALVCSHLCGSKLKLGINKMPVNLPKHGGKQ
jgi:hypothetical protein